MTQTPTSGPSFSLVTTPAQVVIVDLDRVIAVSWQALIAASQRVENTAMLASRRPVLLALIRPHELSSLSNSR